MKSLALLLVASLLFYPIYVSGQKAKTEYQCPPCGNDCDKKTFTRAGECPHCHMKLVKKSTMTFKSIPPTDVCNFVKQHPDVILLDVRTKEEYDGSSHPEHGTFRNAINIPIQELDSRLTELEKYKDREMIVYCSYSKRSSRASYLLAQHGFAKIMNMEGGLSEVPDNECLVRRK